MHVAGAERGGGEGDWGADTATDSDDEGTGSSSEEDVGPGYFDKAYDEAMRTELSSHQAMRVADPFAEPAGAGDLLPLFAFSCPEVVLSDNNNLLFCLPQSSLLRYDFRNLHEDMTACFSSVYPALAFPTS